MDIPDTKDKPAFTRWCVEQTLALLTAKMIHDIDGYKCSYVLRHAARDLVESHPELIQPLVDVEDSDVVYDLAMSYAEGTVIGARDLQTPAKEYLIELTTSMAIDVVICYASTSDEVKALDKERRAILVD